MLNRYDMTNDQDDPERLIDAALDAYPLAPIPPGFTARVMAEVRKPAVAFRLEFIDFAIPAFIALFSAVLLAAGMWAVLSIDRLTMLNLELQGKILLAHLAVMPEQAAMAWIPLAVLCGGMAVVVGVCAGVWMLVSSQRTERSYQ